MHLVKCTPPPPNLGAMMTSLGELTEFRVLLNGNRGSVTLFMETRIGGREARGGGGGGGCWEQNR